MKSLIENAWNERSLLDNKMTQNAIKEVIKKLDRNSPKARNFIFIQKNPFFCEV